MMKLKKDNIHAKFDLEKITINTGVKKLLENSNAYAELENDLFQITLQKPKRIFTKQNNDRFRLKMNELNALKITLRNKKMHNFLNQLSLALAQDKEFLGLNINIFDNKLVKSFTFGIKNQGIFAVVNRNESKIKFGFYITFTFKNVNLHKSDIKSEVLSIFKKYNLLIKEKILL